MYLVCVGYASFGSVVAISARHLSAATTSNILQNLVFAFAYNVAGIPIAAGVLYPITGLLLSPMISAARWPCRRSV